mmetsp:Transcript_92456/g.264145  ORF Transcript_92456/g.264145 Transcript_92456/m.264145 type:complete len:235 (+) Transcript_92456:608-1312(+)
MAQIMITRVMVGELAHACEDVVDRQLASRRLALLLHRGNKTKQRLKAIASLLLARGRASNERRVVARMEHGDAVHEILNGLDLVGLRLLESAQHLVADLRPAEEDGGHITLDKLVVERHEPGRLATQHRHAVAGGGERVLVKRRVLHHDALLGARTRRKLEVRHVRAVHRHVRVDERDDGLRAPERRGQPERTGVEPHACLHHHVADRAGEAVDALLRVADEHDCAALRKHRIR